MRANKCCLAFQHCCCETTAAPSAPHFAQCLHFHVARKELRFVRRVADCSHIASSHVIYYCMPTRVGSRSSATSSNPASTTSVPPQDTSDMISPVTSRIGGGCTSTNSLESAADCRRKNISAIHGSTHSNSCCSLLTVSLSDQSPACTQLRSSVSCYSALQSRLTRAYRMLNPTLSGPTCSQAAIALQRTPARH